MPDRLSKSVAAAQAKVVVKSKSMTSEEIHLNDALEGAGIEAVETDLGEYIIQLAGHRPSHIVAPGHASVGRANRRDSQQARRRAAAGRARSAGRLRPPSAAAEVRRGRRRHLRRQLRHRRDRLDRARHQRRQRPADVRLAQVPHRHHGHGEGHSQAGRPAVLPEGAGPRRRRGRSCRSIRRSSPARGSRASSTGRRSFTW